MATRHRVRVRTTVCGALLLSGCLSTSAQKPVAVVPQTPAPVAPVQAVVPVAPFAPALAPLAPLATLATLLTVFARLPGPQFAVGLSW